MENWLFYKGAVLFCEISLRGSEEKSMAGGKCPEKNVW
jgi:hypothetical protein